MGRAHRHPCSQKLPARGSRCEGRNCEGRSNVLRTSAATAAEAAASQHLQHAANQVAIEQHVCKATATQLACKHRQAGHQQPSPVNTPEERQVCCVAAAGQPRLNGVHQPAQAGSCGWIVRATDEHRPSALFCRPVVCMMQHLGPGKRGNGEAALLALHGMWRRQAGLCCR